MMMLVLMSERNQTMAKDTEITPIEAARRLGMGLNYIYNLLWTGKLAGRKVDNQWFVSLAGVEARAMRRQQITTFSAAR
jgi:hypothetical protein